MPTCNWGKSTKEDGAASVHYRRIYLNRSGWGSLKKWHRS